MPFNIQYLARNSSSGNIDAGKLWVYNGTAILGSNESLATISASGYFNAAQVTLDAIFAAGSTGTTGQLAVNDIIQINGNDATGVFVVTSVTGNVTVVAQSGGGSGTITGATSLGGTFPIYAGVSGSDLTFNGVTLGAGLAGSVSAGALNADVATSAVTPGSYTSTNLTVDSYGRITAAANGSGSGYTPFAYPLSYWQTSAGSDTNLGTSIETPLQTYAASLALTGFGNNGTYGVDLNSTNNETLTINSTGSPGVQFFAPGTSFNGAYTQTNGSYLTCFANTFNNLTLTGANGIFLNCPSQVNNVVASGEFNQLQINTGTFSNSTIGAFDTCDLFANAVFNFTSNGSTTGFIGRTGGSSAITNGGTLTTVISDFSTTWTNTGTFNLVAARQNGAFSNSGTLYANVAYQNGAITNTGNIYGLLGNTMFGGLGMANSADSVPQYTLTGTAPTAANQVLVSSGAGPGAATSWAAQVGFTPHAYTFAYYVDDVAGNDSNSGTSIEEPFLTYQHAINVAGTTAIIYGINANPSNGETITTLGTGQSLWIEAPGTAFGASFTVAAGDTVWANADSFGNFVIASLSFFYGRVNTLTGSISGSATFNANSTGALTLTVNGATVNAYSGSYLSTLISSDPSDIIYLDGNWSTINLSGTAYISGSVAALTTSLTGSAFCTGTQTGITTNAGVIWVNSPTGAVGTNTGTIIGNLGNVNYGSFTDVEGGVFTASIDATASFSDLSTAGKVNVILAQTLAGSGLSSVYKITNIYLNSGGTNFAVGDRDLALTDGTTVYTVIPSASLLSLANAGWGSVSVPFPASAAISTHTQAGANLYLQYSGGTTDYTSGSLTVTVEYARVV